MLYLIDANVALSLMLRRTREHAVLSTWLCCSTTSYPCALSGPEAGQAMDLLSYLAGAGQFVYALSRLLVLLGRDQYTADSQTAQVQRTSRSYSSPF
jgi:hypothetical protein